jgi:hypothetical protein
VLQIKNLLGENKSIKITTKKYSMYLLYMDFEDCVYNKTPDGKIMVGGYSLNSILSEYPIMNSNTNVSPSDIQKGGSNFASLFKDLAVPAGLLYLQQNFNSKEKPIGNLVKDAGIIQDSIYDNLVDLVSVKSRKKHNAKTRKEKNKKIKSSRTRRNR